MNATTNLSSKPASRLFRSARILVPAFVVALGLSHQPTSASAAPPVGGNTGAPDVPTTGNAPSGAAGYTQAPEGFSWRAAPRMEGWAAAWRPQTWPEKAWPAAQTYDPNYVNPKSFTINVQGCVNKADYDLNMAGKDAVNSYTWKVNGGTQTAKRCVRDLNFAAQGIYPVGLEVKDPTGKVLLSKARDVRVRDLLIVAMGDSMSSGEGSPDKVANPGMAKGAEWVDRQCHRSRYAPAALAAKALEDMDPTTSVTFISFACSGATIDKEWSLSPKTLDAYESEAGPKKGSGMLGSYVGIESPTTAGIPWDMAAYKKAGGKGIPSQMEQLKFALGGRKIDSVVMSAGINDAGFSRMIATCVLYKECPTEKIGYGDQPLATRFYNDVKGIPASYERLGKELNPLAKRVLVFEYPNAFTGDDGKTCEFALADVKYPFAITRDESNWIQSGAKTAMLGAIQSGAQRAGFEYVGGVWDAFKGHGYCSSSSKRWFTRAEESAKQQGPNDTTETTGTTHPNPAGYAALSKFIVKGLTDPSENTRPVAVADTYTTPGNQILRVTTGGVLNNDTSPMLVSTLRVANHTQPKNGKVQVNPDGTFAYMPNTGFQGTETFIYTVSDGRNEAFSKVTINVTAPPPAAPPGRVIVATGVLGMKP